MADKYNASPEELERWDASLDDLSARLRPVVEAWAADWRPRGLSEQELAGTVEDAAASLARELFARE